MLDFYIVVNTVFISKKQFKSKKNMIKGDQMCVFWKDNLLKNHAG